MTQREYDADIDNLLCLLDEMRDIARDLEGWNPDEIILDPGPLRRLIGKATGVWKCLTGIEHGMGLSRATRRD